MEKSRRQWLFFCAVIFIALTLLVAQQFFDCQRFQEDCEPSEGQTLFQIYPSESTPSLEPELPYPGPWGNDGYELFDQPEPNHDDYPVL